MKHMISNDPIVARSREHLWSLVREIVMYQGHTCDLNHIDVSGIDDFSLTFESLPFEGNISRWDVSNAVNMSGMFQRSAFNGDISGWDVRNVRYMAYMFANSSFAGNISGWQPNSVEYTQYMFMHNQGQNVANWSLGAVKKMEGMLDPKTLKHQLQPGLYHWYALLEDVDALRGHPCLHAMIEKVKSMATVIQGLSLDHVEAAQLLHREWSLRFQPTSRPALELPDLMQ